MSTVVGLKVGKQVMLGGDTRASTLDGDIRPNVCRKIFRNGKYLFGFIGSVRGGQILYPEYFSPPKNIFDLPDAIRVQCEEKGCMAMSDDQQQIHGCNYLIGYKGKLYEMMIDFQMIEVMDYSAIGSGSSFSFGSFYTTGFSKISSKDRVLLALKAATRFDTATGAPYHIETL